jgi:hypothetical protein
MPVIELRDLADGALLPLLETYGMELIPVREGGRIPASYWGEPEAGLAGRCIFARADTPVHSVLHEMTHYICMSSERRAALWRDAGGDVHEECAVCYLQVLLADRLPGVGRSALLEDLDRWGYSFREGSAAAWFVGDGTAARIWLIDAGLIGVGGNLRFRLRDGAANAL